MRVELFSPQGSWKIQTDAAVLAEEAGFDSFACPEIAHDPFIPLALAAQRTTRVGLRTAIAVAFARSPMVTANLAWDLHSESGGRFVLGLGTQIQAHVERRFAGTWAKPRSQLREYVQAIRAIHRSWEKREKLRFLGEHYKLTLMTPEFAPAPTGLAPVPIYTAAVRPGMIELAAEVADGVRLHGFMTRRYLDQVGLPALERGLAARGRPRSRFEVCGGGFVATGADDDAVRKMREVIRYRVAFYASTPSYWPVLEAHGWQPLGEKLRAMTLAGRWQAMASEVPDDVLEAFCVAAPWRDLRPAVEARFGGVADSIELAFPGDSDIGALREVVRDLQTIPIQVLSAGTTWDEIPAGETDSAKGVSHLSTRAMRTVVAPFRHLHGLRVSNVFLLDGGRGDRWLIDTGHVAERATLLFELWRAGIAPRDLTGALLTHRHSDHAGNAAFLQRAGVRICAQRADAAVLAGDAPRPRLTRGEGNAIAGLFAAIENRFPAERVVVDLALDGGDVIAGLEVHEVPGHTEGSVFYRHPATGSLCSGDTLLTAHPPLTIRRGLATPYPSFTTDMPRAFASLRAFHATGLGYENLLAGHGPPLLGSARDKVLELIG